MIRRRTTPRRVAHSLVRGRCGFGPNGQYRKRLQRCSRSQLHSGGGRACRAAAGGNLATEEQARQTKGFTMVEVKGLSGGLCGLYQRCRKPAAAGGCGRLCEPPLYRLQHHISGRRHRGNSSHSLPGAIRKARCCHCFAPLGQRVRQLCEQKPRRKFGI